MAKKKNTFGKLLAFTTTAVAIGGTCYIYRDKIKQSSIYKTISGKFSDIFGHISNEFCDNEDEDFFFDEEDDDFEDAFSEGTEHGREYTSITINAKEDSKKEAEPANEQDIKNNPDSTEENVPISNNVSSLQEDSSENNNVNPFQENSSLKDTAASDENSIENDNANSTEDNADNENEQAESDKMFSNEDLIEIFPKDSIANIKVGNTSKPEDSVLEKNISSTGKNSYENEGLSDVSEDPDTLESQDKLDI